MATSFFTELEIEKIRSHLSLKDLTVVLDEMTSVEIHQQISLLFINRATSISHCQNFGGFISTTEKVGLGFDIEKIERVTDVAVLRVCPELTKLPVQASSLWSAKEATFKSLKRQKQPVVLSDFELSDWQSLDSQFETFCLKDFRKWESGGFSGVCIRKNSYQFAFAVSRP